jgi:hypothetical protein
MDKSDSSLLRSLAVAFGDGLAFGVGMKLTQTGAGKSTAAGPSDQSGRLARIEQRLERAERAPAALAGSPSLDPRVLEALTRSLEARLQEHAALTDRRLAELDVNLSLELKSLREQDRSLATASQAGLQEIQKYLDEQHRALARQVNEDRAALQNQVIALHREFAAAVADIVEGQVATQMEQRLGTLVEQRLAGLVREQLAPLEQELREEIRQASAAKHREIADLRQRITESDRNVLDVLLSTGELFRQAAGRLGASPGTAIPEPLPPATESPGAADDRPAEPPPPAVHPDTPSVPENSANGTVLYKDSELPSFARPRTRAAAASWSIPLVTSFLVTAGCVAFLQYF